MTDILPPDPTQQDHRPAVYQDESGLWIYRASAIGFCTKMLLAIRQGYELKETPEKIRARMDESSALENEAIDKFIAEHSQQITYIDREVRPTSIRVKEGVYIRGKPDTAIELRDGRRGIVEVKNLGDALFKANTVSIKPYYKAQGTVYMVGWDFIVFVLRNKDTGKMFYKWYTTLPMPYGDLHRKVLHIESQATNLELPESCDPVQYPCPVFYLHERDRIENWTDPDLQQDFEELSRAYDEARLREKNAKDEKKALQNELKAFRARYASLTDTDGNLESPRAKFTKGSWTKREVDEKELEWFLAQHDRSIEDFMNVRTFDVWRVTWRG